MKLFRHAWPLMLASLLWVNTVHAANILIVNGASASVEPDTTADITQNLPIACGPAHTYAVADVPPADMSAYDQVWDLRFSDSSPLTAADQAAYLGLLQSGKNIFVMGESALFMTRNNSVIDFVTLTGGGSLSFVSPDDLQAVTGGAPFTDNGLSSVVYNVAGGVTTSGNGLFVTRDAAAGGAALAWKTGVLANAPAGALAVVFDVNFMEPAASANERQLLRNMCTFVRTGGAAVAPTEVPASSPATLLGLAGLLCVLGGHGLRMRTRARRSQG